MDNLEIQLSPKKRVVLAGFWNTHYPLHLGMLRALIHLDCAPVYFADETITELVRESLKETATEVEFLSISGQDEKSYHKIVEYSNAHASLAIVEGVLSNAEILVRLKWSCPVVLTVHNVRGWFCKYRIRSFEALARNLALKKIRKKYAGFIVPSSLMKDWVRENTKNTAPIEVSFGTVFDEESWRVRRAPAKDRLEVTISGSVLAHRRDYGEALEAWAKAFGDNPDAARLTLLGRCFTQFVPELVQRIKELKAKGLLIDCFEDFLPKEKFDSHMGISHVMLCPLFTGKRYPQRGLSQYEIAGYTKVTGSYGDQITHCLPSIYPKNYPLESEMEPSAVRYESIDHLAEILRDFADNRSQLGPLQDKALEFSRSKSTACVAREQMEPILAYSN